jgi:hypothetical protein
MYRPAGCIPGDSVLCIEWLEAGTFSTLRRDNIHVGMSLATRVLLANEGGEFFFMWHVKRKAVFESEKTSYHEN